MVTGWFEGETQDGADIRQWASVLGKSGCPPAPAAHGKPSSESHGEPWPRSALPAQPTPVVFTTVMEIVVVTPGLSRQQAPQDARIGPSGGGGGGILQPLQLQTGKPRSPGKAWLLWDQT